MGFNGKYGEIGERYGTPYYLFELTELYKRVSRIKNILGKQIKLCYAMKANPFLIAYLDHMVDCFEVCSPGEYEVCKYEGIDLKKIILSGVYKDEASIRETFEDQFNGVYTIESESQCELLYKLAKEYDRKIRVLLRMTSGNQFGMNKDEIEKIIDFEEYKDYFEVEGIHYFSGTQKKNKDLIQTEINEVVEFIKYIKRTYDIAIKKIEYGPGLFVNYFDAKTDDIDEAYFLADKLKSILETAEITVELGRYLVASCGKYITKIVDTKQNQDVNYAIVDGGSHHIKYFGQMLGLKAPKTVVLKEEEHKGTDKEKWMICGALCSIHDVLLKNYETTHLQKGDIIVFYDAGAYAMTDTSILFLSRELPCILVESENGDIECLRNKIKSSAFNTRKDKKEGKNECFIG